MRQGLYINFNYEMNRMNKLELFNDGDSIFNSNLFKFIQYYLT